VHSYFTDEEIEAQGGEVIFPKIELSSEFCSEFGPGFKTFNILRHFLQFHILVPFLLGRNTIYSLSLGNCVMLSNFLYLSGFSFLIYKMKRQG
jgi:hypothetical protein